MSAYPVVLAFLKYSAPFLGRKSTGGVLTIGIPIACNANIPDGTKLESCIRGTSGIGIAQQKGDFRTAIDADGVDAITIPVPGDRLIAGLAKGEGQVNMTCDIGIAEVEDAIAIDADGVAAIAIPVTHHRVIAWRTKFFSDIAELQRSWNS